MFAFVATTLLAFAAAQAPIPGTDVMSRGFDMVAGAQNSSFNGDPLLPVWALTYDSGTKWTAPYDPSLIYTVPDQLTVTDIDRSDLQISSVLIDTYDDYITEAKSSFNIGIGASVSIGNDTDALGVNAKFNHESYSYKQTMKANMTASGYSKYYMDLFTLETNPPFLMKASSQFNAMIQHLPASIATPADQAIYNEAVQYFGTHTPMMASFGGRFHLSTFVSKLVMEQHSASWTYNQMSLTFHFEMFNLSAGGFKNRSDIHIDAAFKGASHTEVFFAGGDPTLQSNTTVNEWIKSVPETPAYLNVTLIDLSQVVETVDAGKAANLKKTLISYMKTGELPDSTGAITDYDAYYAQFEEDTVESATQERHVKNQEAATLLRGKPMME